MSKMEFQPRIGMDLMNFFQEPRASKLTTVEKCMEKIFETSPDKSIWIICGLVIYEENPLAAVSDACHRRSRLCIFVLMWLSD